jgi:hypothetical protein
MESLPKEISRMILKDLSQKDLSNLTQTSKTTNNQVQFFYDLMEQYINKISDQNNPDQLIFDIANGRMKINDPMQILNKNNVLEYLLKDKKFADTQELDQRIKEYISRQLSPITILRFLLYGNYGMVVISRFIQGFSSPEFKNQLKRDLGFFYQQYQRSNLAMNRN